MENRSFVPNIFTFMNLSLGIMAILMAMEGNFENAAIFIIGAGIVDRYDGRIARMLKAESKIGKELDSLADNVSFGVSPAVLIYLMYDLKSFGIPGLLAILIYCISGMYRLARYNSMEFTGVFTGVPITISGTTLALLTLALGNESNMVVIPMIIIMLLFSYLMVSNVSFKKV